MIDSRNIFPEILRMSRLIDSKCNVFAIGERVQKEHIDDDFNYRFEVGIYSKIIDAKIFRRSLNSLMESLLDERSEKPSLLVIKFSTSDIKKIIKSHTDAEEL